jgi:hypothetical protein
MCLYLRGGGIRRMAGIGGSSKKKGRIWFTWRFVRQTFDPSTRVVRV